MDIESGSIGSVGSQKLSFEKGKVVAEVAAQIGPAELALAVKLDSGVLLDLIAAAIPGHFDDIVIGLAKEKLAQLG